MVSPQSSLLQAEQPQLSQPFLTGEVLHPSDDFCGPPLDPLQNACVILVLRAPELDAGLQVGSHQSRVEGQNHLPRPAGHTSLDAAQDAVGKNGFCKFKVLSNVYLSLLDCTLAPLWLQKVMMSFEMFLFIITLSV